MLHSFTAYLRALWSACHGYDLIASEDLVDVSDAYTAACIEEYEECGAVQLDEPYYFGAMVTQRWSLASRMSITPRKMWNFADWGVRYDHGTFLRNSGLRNSRGCDIRNVAQSEYFELATDADTEAECERVRRPIHELSEGELALFVEGLQEVRRIGKYQSMVEAQVHRGASFFLYHAYFVWEVETQIRALGGRFACFSMPYYDWTIDAGRGADTAFVLNSVFGGDGDAEHNNCVDSWGVEQWPLHELCAADEQPASGCCLKRRLAPAVDTLFSDAAELGALLEHAGLSEMAAGVMRLHHAMHARFGGHMASDYAADDPVDLVLHSFTAYLRALWASCHGYDRVDAAQLDGAMQLDDAYDFGALADEAWALASQTQITPRKLWDFADWHVRFDHGSFYGESGLRRSQLCDQRNVARSAWFVHEEEEDEQEVTETEQEELSEQIRVAHEGSRLSQQSKMILVSSATVFASAAVLFVCAYFLVRSNKKLDPRYNLVSGSPTDLYGATAEQYKL